MTDSALLANSTWRSSTKGNQHRTLLAATRRGSTNNPLVPKCLQAVRATDWSGTED